MTAGDARERVLAAPGADGWRFDPAALLRAVNALAGSDTAHALGVLRDGAAELATRAAGPEPPLSGPVLVALALFEADDAAASLPAPPFGAPDLPLPPPGPGLERLPLVLERQVPFLLVGGYRAGGAADVPGWLERCAAGAHPRRAALAPERSPIEAIDALTTGARWEELIPAAHRPRVLAMLRAQALRAAGEPFGGTELALADADRWDDAARSTRGARWKADEERFAP